jgi:lipopolysaccharide biosynthesis protein
LLERPVEEMRESGRPDFPYCFCWANENWTRRWDGADREVLIAQNPSRADDERLIRDLLPHFRDPRYIRVGGRTLLVVCRVGVLPNALASAAVWREVCRHEGIGELYLCAAKTYDTGDPARYGFDAVVEFPPHGVRTPPITAQVDLVNAWNEWAEAAHLEPDRRFGHQYLEATRRALVGAPAGGTAFARFTGRLAGAAAPGAA